MFTEQPLDLRADKTSQKFRGVAHRPTRHNLALIFTPFCFVRAARAAGRHATTPTFSFTNCLVWSCLSFSARSPSIGKTYQREQTAAVCCRESSAADSQPAGQDLRHYLVFQLFGSGKSTLEVIVLLHSGGSGADFALSRAGRRACLAAAITPTPSENIIDLEIKRAARLQIGFHACLILQCGFGGQTLFFPVRANVTC